MDIADEVHAVELAVDCRAKVRPSDPGKRGTGKDFSALSGFRAPASALCWVLLRIDGSLLVWGV